RAESSDEVLLEITPAFRTFGRCSFEPSLSESFHTLSVGPPEKEILCNSIRSCPLISKVELSGQVNLLLLLFGSRARWEFFEVGSLCRNLKLDDVCEGKCCRNSLKWGSIYRWNSLKVGSLCRLFSSQIGCEGVMVMHRDYLKVTKEHLETLQELLEQTRALKPLDENLDYACKVVQRIQELLVYVSASCPFIVSENEKWAPATSHKKNNKLYVDTLGRVSYTNSSRSQPRINTKNDRIQRPSSKSEKNTIVEIVLWYFFADLDLEVEFRKHTYFICNLDGVDLLSGSCGTNNYTISLNDMMDVPLLLFIIQSSKTEKPVFMRIVGTRDVGITHQMSVARTLQQNGVVERRNHTLVEAARTMLIFSKSPLC
ncbi:retrovirus-related pol polyprotein from transposon TNT 1-94, partial [Tanacetum coccineum]